MVLHTVFFSLRHFGHFLLRYFGHWNISVICLTVVLKLAVTKFFNLCFQTFWPKWLNFFRSFQNHFGLWPKKTGCMWLITSAGDREVNHMTVGQAEVTFASKGKLRIQKGDIFGNEQHYIKHCKFFWKIKRPSAYRRRVNSSKFCKVDSWFWATSTLKMAGRSLVPNDGATLEVSQLRL